MTQTLTVGHRMIRNHQRKTGKSQLNWAVNLGPTHNDFKEAGGSVGRGERKARVECIGIVGLAVPA